MLAYILPSHGATTLFMSLSLFDAENWLRSRSFETVSLDLMDALADLEELQEALSGSTAVKADDNAQLADMAAKFFKGLSVIHLVCNTGQGIPLSLPLFTTCCASGLQISAFAYIAAG